MALISFFVAKLNPFSPAPLPEQTRQLVASASAIAVPTRLRLSE
jgi:hypothetical protein